MLEKIAYMKKHNVGITAENPSGIWEERCEYSREVYNNEGRTAYKDAVARAIGWEYVDFSASELEFKAAHERHLEKIFVSELRGGVSYEVSQDKWLAKLEQANQKVAEMVNALRNAHH